MSKRCVEYQQQRDIQKAKREPTKKPVTMEDFQNIKELNVHRRNKKIMQQQAILYGVSCLDESILNVKTLQKNLKHRKSLASALVQDKL